MDQIENIMENENFEQRFITPIDQIESDSAKEEISHSKFLSFEEFKKLQSDSSLFSDYSSENSETVADSDVSSRKNFQCSTKLKLYETEYPKIRLNKRSKSLMFKKKKYIENVVNEESIEEERDNSIQVKRNPFRFNNYEIGDDIPNSFEKSRDKPLKIKRINSMLTSPKISAICNSSTLKNMVFMDPVVEVKEDGEAKIENKLKLSSPRIKYLKDIFEDNSMSINSPSKNFFPKDFSLSVDNADIIAEDNNENLEENNEKGFKKIETNLHKMIESVIDKEEIYEIKELKVDTEVFEIIKEETVEEEVFIKHSSTGKIIFKNFIVIPIADEVDEENKIFSKNLRVSVIAEADEDELINEDDENLIDDEKEETEFI